MYTYMTIDFSTFLTFLVNDFFSRHQTTISDRISGETIFTRQPRRRLPHTRNRVSLAHILYYKILYEQITIAKY